MKEINWLDANKIYTEIGDRLKPVPYNKWPLGVYMCDRDFLVIETDKMYLRVNTYGKTASGATAHVKIADDKKVNVTNLDGPWVKYAKGLIDSVAQQAKILEQQELAERAAIKEEKLKQAAEVFE